MAKNVMTVTQYDNNRHCDNERNGTQYSNIQHDDTNHNNTEHNATEHNRTHHKDWAFFIVSQLCAFPPRYT